MWPLLKTVFLKHLFMIHWWSGVKLKDEWLVQRQQMRRYQSSKNFKIYHKLKHTHNSQLLNFVEPISEHWSYLCFLHAKIVRDLVNIHVHSSNVYIILDQGQKEFSMAKYKLHALQITYIAVMLKVGIPRLTLQILGLYQFLVWAVQTLGLVKF